MELLETLRKWRNAERWKKCVKFVNAVEKIPFCNHYWQGELQPRPRSCRALATPKKVHFPFLTANELPSSLTI